MAVGLEERPAAITSVRRLARRHVFVAFCREGQMTSDFRMGLTTHEADVANIPAEMVEWVDQAWRNRNPNQSLVFPPPGRFLVINICYKETETFLTEDWKFRISQIAKGDRTNIIPNKTWECRLSSRSFKWNYGLTDTAKTSEDMDSAVESEVVALVKEAVKFSESIEF
uniref:Uncharacterized protein n=1 Tax=Picea sitchensis TaxID=3332 RepID=D5AAI5_PICSI|nr:unknown [Picea sitchensis]